MDTSPETEKLLSLPQIPGTHSVMMTVIYFDDTSDEWEVRGNGSWAWRYATNPDRLVIRPIGKGLPRIEIPLFQIKNVRLTRVPGA